MKKPIELLVVEDNEDNIRAAQEHFSTVEHITATFARTYAQAIALLDHKRYDAAIVDPDFPRDETCAPELLGPELSELLSPDGKYRVPYVFFTETAYRAPQKRSLKPDHNDPLWVFEHGNAPIDTRELYERASCSRRQPKQERIFKIKAPDVEARKEKAEYLLKKMGLKENNYNLSIDGDELSFSLKQHNRPEDLVGQVVETAANLDTFSGFRMPLKNQPYAWSEAYRILKNIVPEYRMRIISQSHVKQSLRGERNGRANEKRCR